MATMKFLCLAVLLVGTLPQASEGAAWHSGLRAYHFKGVEISSSGAPIKIDRGGGLWDPDKEKKAEAKEAEAEAAASEAPEEPEEPAAPAWTSAEPDSTDYNPQTEVSGLPFTVETLFAIIYCLMLASSPVVLAALADSQLTRAHMLESVALITWLGGVLWLFTHVLKFQSAHWEGFRPLTLVEAVYLLSQIVTTVGYGDITPAFPRGQVWVGFNVILALCLYGSMITEVIGIVQMRVAKALADDGDSRQANQPLKDWSKELRVTYQPLIKSACSFLVLATVGVLFWHHYPGEGKTWLQAVYMSVITLSTVGFGAFSATTEGGKVFGAFWMLFGVATLGALISTFIDTMFAEKAAEAKRSRDLGSDFRQMLDKVSQGRAKMTKAEFLKFALMFTKETDASEFTKIEARFKALLNKEDGQMLRRTRLVDIEGPPL